MAKKLDTENCIGIHFFAQAHECEKLEFDAWDWITESFDCVSETAEFLELSADNLIEVIKYDDYIRVGGETAAKADGLMRAEGKDYDKDDLTWLWRVTSLDDERIIRHNQSGVNSQYFQPGPLGEMETSIQAFYDFYFAMISPEPEQRMAANG